MSRSAPAIKLSSISTMVIFEPKALYTVAISKPTIPPPITNKCPGISVNSSAPVESMIRESSGKNGSLAGFEPAAITAFSKYIVVFLPSLSVT